MSDNYIVSARKYRPQTFDTVVGQGHITTTLKNAIKNQHLAHAYLFCGPRGVGKTTCARILAKTINCEHPTADMEACGVCPTCESLKNNASFNVFELDAASNNGVEHIRELTDQVRFAPQHGKYKVYIIDEVHMLSASAFNAFLKTLEEPPSYAIFILATTEKHKILPTILSRCQIFDFKRITTDDITSHLQSIAGKESMVAQEAALHIIAQKSEGCMRDALSMLDRIASFTNGMLTYANTMEHLNLLDADFYFQLVDHMLSQDVASTLLQLDKALDKGFEGDLIINGLGMHFRNLLLCKDPRMAKMLDIPNEFKPLYHEKANQAPPSYIISAINIINDCELHYKSAANRRLHVELCLLRMCYLQQAIAGQQSVTIAEDVKKKPEPRTLTEANSINNTSIESSKSVDYEVVAEKIATASMPANVSESPIPVSHSAPVVTTAPIPQAAPKPANRRLSMGMLADIEAQVNKAAEEVDQSEKILTEVTALTLFEKYKQKLVHETKNIIHAQFLMMQVQVLPPDELRLISPSELTDTYARDQRTALQDFYKLETKMNVRITTEIRLDETGNSLQNQPVVLSRSEMYDAMVQKNPNLARLKDALNMQVEY